MELGMTAEATAANIEDTKKDLADGMMIEPGDLATGLQVQIEVDGTISVILARYIHFFLVSVILFQEKADLGLVEEAALEVNGGRRRSSREWSSSPLVSRRGTEYAVWMPAGIRGVYGDSAPYRQYVPTEVRGL